MNLFVKQSVHNVLLNHLVNIPLYILYIHFIFVECSDFLELDNKSDFCSLCKQFENLLSL